MAETGPYDLSQMASAMIAPPAPMPSVYEFIAPAQIAQQRAYGRSLLDAGMSTDPLQGSGWAKALGALNRGAQGALGGYAMRRAGETEAANEKAKRDAIAAATQGGVDWSKLATVPGMEGASISGMVADKRMQAQDARDAQRYAEQNERMDRQQTFAERQAEAARQFQREQLGEQRAARTAQQAEAAAARQEAARLQAELARGNRVTYRPTTAEERQQFPGAVQVGSDGKFVFAPAEAIKQTFVAPGSAPADRAAQANALGVPDKLDVDPYSALSPKAREERAKREQAAYVKEMDKDREERAKLEAQLVDLDRFEQAEQRADLGAVGRFAAGLPGASLVDSDIATMQSVTAKVAPTIRQAGSGATSDYDAKQFKLAVVGAEKPRETNQQILAAYRGAAKNAMNFMDFKQAFMDTHGTTAGADRAWKKYLNANPIFDEAAGGTALNQNRMDWQDWFRQQNAQSRQGGGQGGSQGGETQPRGATGGWSADTKPQGTAPKRLKFNPATGDFE